MINATSPKAIEETIHQRETTYGKFADNARIAQGIKDNLKSGSSWEKLSPVQREGLEMIAHKMARAVNGDPGYTDSYHDIIGYGQLIESEMVSTSDTIPPVV